MIICDVGLLPVYMWEGHSSGFRLEVYLFATDSSCLQFSDMLPYVAPYQTSAVAQDCCICGGYSALIVVHVCLAGDTYHVWHCQVIVVPVVCLQWWHSEVSELKTLSQFLKQKK